jgi:twitching motility two-component system response regulator PilH
MTKQVLVVDDSPTELKVTSSAVSQAGYKVIQAVDGEDALAKAIAFKPKVMVLDIILPKKNGFQVCRQLKTTPETADIKIVLLSSKSQESDRFWGIRQGADAYVTKPFSPTELLTHVREFMAQ